MTPKPLDQLARDGHRPRVLIARTSAIGDTILTAPVACRIRDAFPDAFVAWVVEEKSAAFVVDHPAIDEAVVLPRGWFTDWSKLRDARRRLRSLRVDIAIDCQGLTKTALACWLSGARVRVGLRGDHGRELSTWMNNRLVEPNRPHVTDRSLALVESIGALVDSGDRPRWDLPQDAAAARRVGSWLAGQPRLTDAPGGFAVINPGASWDSKLWENDRFATLARRLLDAEGLPSVVVWGGEREHGWALAIAAASGGAAVAAPRTSLVELAELLRQARLVVSPDTGPMHLAVAVGAPTVGLFGVTRPEECGPYGWPHEAVQRRYHDGSRRERRGADNSAMREIGVDDAYDACLAVLQRSEGRFRSDRPSIAS